MKSNIRSLILLALLAVLAVLGYVIDTHRVANQRLRAAFPSDSRAILDHASQIELYSLCPMTDPCIMAGKSKGKFHDVEVLGKTLVTGSRKAALLSALYHGIAYNDNSPAACFNPRHAIHCVQGKQTIDVVICFECENVEIYMNGLEAGAITSREPQELFNQTLSDAGVSLAKP